MKKASSYFKSYDLIVITHRQKSISEIDKSISEIIYGYIKKAHLPSEMFIKLRGKSENRILFSDTVTHLAAPLPYHFGSAHHPVTHHSQMLHPSSSLNWLITWLPTQ